MELDVQRGTRKVNRIRPKLECVTDMIVDLDQVFVTRNGSYLVTLLEVSEIEFTTINQPIKNSVTWRKRCNKEWNSELESWQSCDPRIVDERFILIRIKGEEFCLFVVQNTISDFIHSIKQKVKKKGLIIVIEGLDKYILGKSKETRTDFQNAVRSFNQDAIQGGTIRSHTVPREALIQNTLIYLHLEEDCLVHITATSDETADYIAEFTREIALLSETE